MQLQVEYSDERESRTVPIEDIGMVVLEDQSITISNALLMALAENGAAVLICNAKHLPEGLMLNMSTHHAFTEKVKAQMEASIPLKKNLWQQTIQSKIRNQATLLQYVGVATENMEYWASRVKSGDPDNYEARAAAFYWSALFEMPQFRRGRYEDPPNNLLNYGYAILRGVVARALVGSGMMTFTGIHHRNKYNPYCLADDIMEPYRPYVDKMVIEIIKKFPVYEELTKEVKFELLGIPAMDVLINGQLSPLMVAMQTTTASLAKCFSGETRKIIYPEMQCN